MEESQVVLSPLNKKLLRRVLRGGMNGSYYEHGDIPSGDDIQGYIDMQLDVITNDRLEQIADFYSLRDKDDLMEVISDEVECDKWLRIRSVPFDDPW